MLESFQNILRMHIGIPGHCGAATPQWPLFSFGHAQRIGNRLRGLPRACFIRHDAVVVEVTDHRQVQHTLLGVDVRDVRDPFAVWLVCALYSAGFCTYGAAVPSVSILSGGGYQITNHTFS